MKSKSLLRLFMFFIFGFSLLLMGCNQNKGIISETEKSIELEKKLPDNEVTLVMKNFLKDVNRSAEIKEDRFEWLNYAEYDYNNYTGGYYDIKGYSLVLTGVKAFPNVNKVFDGWYVHYVGDEIGGSAVDYSKDNIICSYFLSLEQEIPYELINREGDYEDEQQQAEYDKKRSDFYDIATYSVELSCGYIPEGAIQFKDFNYYSEGMEPFWRAYFVGDYISLFTPDGMEEHYIDAIKSEGKNFTFNGYDIDGKLEKFDCIDGGKGDTHEYKISFDVIKSSYGDDGEKHIDGTAHYEGCADKENPKFIPGEEGMLKSFIKKSGYKYDKDYEQDKVSYTIGNMVGNYMIVNFYYVDGENYESYQNLIEISDNKLKVLYEGEGYDISDEECERLNQYDNNLMDMFFLKNCPRG